MLKTIATLAAAFIGTVSLAGTDAEAGYKGHGFRHGHYGFKHFGYGHKHFRFGHYGYGYGYSYGYKRYKPVFHYKPAFGWGYGGHKRQW